MPLMTKRGFYTRFTLLLVVGLGSLLGAWFYVSTGDLLSAGLYTVMGVGMFVMAASVLVLWRQDRSSK